MTDKAVRIEFSDRTMIETDGDYMSVDMLVSPGVMSPWMVRTVASVSVADVYCEFVLKICIYFTHHSHLLLYLQFTMLLRFFLNNQIALSVCTALLCSTTLLTERVVLKTFAA